MIRPYEVRSEVITTPSDRLRNPIDEPTCCSAADLEDSILSAARLAIIVDTASQSALALREGGCQLCYSVLLGTPGDRLLVLNHL